MKGSKKRLMDALKVLARNLFYIMLDPFKEDYDNYRDDHVIFRILTTSCEIIEADENQVKCQLVLEPDYPPQIRRHLEKYLADWNAQGPRDPRRLRSRTHAQTDHRSGNSNCAFKSCRFPKSLSSGLRATTLPFLWDRRFLEGYGRLPHPGHQITGARLCPINHLAVGVVGVCKKNELQILRPLDIGLRHRPDHHPEHRNPFTVNSVA
jgi:hypothetical protein